VPAPGYEARGSIVLCYVWVVENSPSVCLSVYLSPGLYKDQYFHTAVIAPLLKYRSTYICTYSYAYSPTIFIT